ncbi:MAG TPA: tripartite tricarboxylate transporter substrate binding protein [Magnetospirillaceae bacterium]|nr:tripartite tricarboxylate transporter substrate binding protein [Magnetospirillaceae bacterium]
MNRAIRILAVALALASATAVYSQAAWRPVRPITIIVPWGAGGSTDQVTRLAAADLEPVLGQRIIIVNQPGASGSVGTRNVMEAPRDGYTWSAGSATGLATYRVQGMLETDIRKDWHIFLSVANVPVVSVNPASAFRDFGELLEGFRRRGSQISVATAGLTSSGHIAIEQIRSQTGIEYRHVPYGGGAPAVIATVAGEAEVTSQLATEQADMIRARRLRPLAVLSDQPLMLDGFGEIPPITRWIPDFKPVRMFFGIFIPSGVPAEVIATVGRAWQDAIGRSTRLQEFARVSGAVFSPSWGQEAQDIAFRYYQPVAWLFFDAGQARVSPDTVGIPRP